jgi:hypothetical protein
MNTSTPSTRSCRSGFRLVGPGRLAAWTAAAALLPLAGAHAGDPPKLKEGLWEIHAQTIENPGEKTTQIIYKLCRDHAYDKAADALLKDVKGCTTILKDLGDGKFASASNCAVNGITVVSNGVTVFKSNSFTHSETQAKYVPAFNGKAEEAMTQDQQYIGACPTGVKVGDTISADGFIRHHK